MSIPNLDAFKVVNPEVKCVIGLLNFTPDQKIIFDMAMEANRFDFPAANILRVINDEWGFDSKLTSLKAHRRKECLCYKNHSADQENND